MRDLIWVRIFITGLALFGESALASENNSTIEDTTSFSSLIAEVSSHFTDADTDSDNHQLTTHLQLVNSNLQHIDTCWVFDSNNIPAQQRYLLSFPHAPPATLI
jgi:hypothetical protein